MTTALLAPLNGAKLLMASPASPTNTPLPLDSNVPWASNVFSVKTDLAAFFTHDCAWVDKGKRVKR